MVHEPRDHYIRRLAAAWPDNDPDGFHEMVGRLYPKDTSEAVAEMRERGCVASQWRIQQLSDWLRLRQLGGTFCWYPDDIDKACQHLEEVRGGLTHEAAFARSRGLTLVQLRELEQKTLAAAQKAVAHEST